MRLCQKEEELEREDRADEKELGESNPIADAIYGGLAEIAGAINRHANAVQLVAEALRGEEPEVAEPETYLDGKRK